MQKEKTKTLFRREALEKLRSPEQLDTLFAPTTPVAWITLLVILLLVASVLIWSIFGVITTKVSGTGLIVDANGSANIYSTTSGRLKELRVKVGERVSRGQVVATVEQLEMEAQLAKLKRDLDQAAPSDERTTKEANLLEFQEKLQRNSQVVSPVDGIVADQIANGMGDILAPGTPLLNVRIDEERKGELLVLLYVPVLEGKKIQQGMMVQISPGSVDTAEYGTLLGQVRSVSHYPVMADSITNWTGNKELTAWILKQTGGVAMEVKVELLKNSETETGYLWSSVRGAPEKITPGTACTGTVIVKRQAPITKAFLNLNRSDGK